MKRFYLPLLALTLLGCGLILRSIYAGAAHDTARLIEREDAAGKDVSLRLAQLKEYSATHAGSGVTVELKGSYERAVKEAADRNARAASTANIYKQAQAACGGRRDAREQARCNQQFLSERLTPADIATPVGPPDPAAYRQQIPSPFWAADIAGIFQAAGLILLFYVVVRFAFRRRRS